jgi:hypothetical protein
MIWVSRATLIWFLVVLGPAAWLLKSGITITQSIAPETMMPDGGFALYAPISPPLFFETVADNLQDPTVSQLQLFENGNQLGPPHSVQTTIRAEGHGEFSHWADHVYFSSSGGSNPKTDGHSYTAKYPIYLMPWAALLWFVVPIPLFAASRLLTLRPRQAQTVQGDDINNQGMAVLSRPKNDLREKEVGSPLKAQPHWITLARGAVAALARDPLDDVVLLPLRLRLQELVSWNSLALLVAWLVFYLVALVLIDSSLQADQKPGKTYQINFEYKVF